MKLVTYLMYDGHAEAAFDFYAKCLGGNVAMLMRYGDMPGDEAIPEESRNKVAHVRLEIGDQSLMASDSHPSQPYAGSKGFSVSLTVDTVAEAERFFEALKQGAHVTMPLAETFWATRFGMLVDQFGVAWMINCEKKP